MGLCASMLMLAGCASGVAGVVKGAAPSDAASLATCPNRPSCVVSREDAGSRSIEALAFQGEATDAIARLSAILAEMPRTRIVSSDTHYLHATQESRMLGFTDDVEFLIDPLSGRIDVRSCSRAGYYDFGVNRARIEAIRDALSGP
jgi:uncharacterized protein (DUF1499 family)